MFSQHTLLDYVSVYYADADLRMSDVPNREFMCRYERFSKRHMHFPTLDTLKQELVRRPPYHLYAGAALYLDAEFRDTSKLDAWVDPEGDGLQEPGSMLKKGRQGTDLFFDLDCDHLPGVSGYMNSLESIGKDALRLHDDFLIEDYGWTEDDIDIRFSGSRGFHFYIEDPSARRMSQNERTMIQNHVLGNGLTRSALLEERQRHSNKWGVERASYNLHSTEWSGWASRFTKTYFDMCKDLLVLPSVEEREATIRSWWPRKTGSSKPGFFKRPKWVATDKDGKLTDPPKRVNGRAVSPIVEMLTNRRIVKRVADSGNLTWGFNTVGLTGVSAQKSFIEMVVQQAQQRYGCEIDPLTDDITRQLRVPGSLHLGKGLPCFSIEKELLEDIPTLLMKASEITGSQMVSTRLYNDVTIDIGRDASYSAGIHELPRWKALMLVCEDTKQTVKRKKADAPVKTEAPTVA
jgi:DNA primase small subunit